MDHPANCPIIRPRYLKRRLLFMIAGLICSPIIDGLLDVSWAAVPPAPSNLVATTASSRQINLSWTDNANSRAEYYIERAPTSSGTWSVIATLPKGSTSYQNADLIQNSTYFYRIRCKAGSSYSSYSNTVNATTAFLVAPLNLTANAALATQIRLSWSDTNAYEVYYIIERGSTSTGPFFTNGSVGANVTTFLDSGLATGFELFYRIRAHDGVNYSPYSNLVNQTIYTLSSSAGVGGVISPSGSIGANAGGGQTFTMTPSAGYLVADVLVDGSSVGPVTSYTFSAINSNHTIAVSFADRTPPTGSISINVGAAVTGTPLVTLALMAADSGSGVVEMQLSNDGQNWSAPEPFVELPYQVGHAWTLSDGDGTKTVYVQFRDNAGNWSSAYGDTILMDANPPVVTITSPASDIVTNPETTLLEFSLSETASVNLIVDGTTTRPIRSGESLGFISAGTHTLRVEATDSMGHVGFAEITVTIPELTATITSPIPGISTSSTPLLLYAYNYGTKSLLLDGISINIASGSTLGPLTEGPHTLRLTTTSTAGAQSTAEVQFTVDTQPPIPAIAGKVTKLSAGMWHTMAITQDGCLWVWGYQSLSKNCSYSSTSPQRIGGDTDWSIISTKTDHNVAIKNDGTLWAWGHNEAGQVGDGSGMDQCSPTKIGTDRNWKAVTAGGYHTVALKSDGTLWAWGQNTHGQLGDGSTTNRPYPIKIGSDTNWIAISAGREHTVALKSNGTLWAWGYNGYGQLGDNSLVDQHAPVQVGTDANWNAMSAGYSHNNAIKSNGTLWGWGTGYFEWAPGYWGDVTQFVPTQLRSDADWVSVSVGTDNNIALKSNGTIWEWGHNNIYTPLYLHQTGSEQTWSSIVAGYRDVIALRSDDSIWAWGDNQNGKLGDGTVQNRNAPKYLGHYLIMPTNGVLINNGDAYTNSNTVSLAITAGDATSGVAMMQFSNDDTTWTDPEPYAGGSQDWTLTPGDGSKTVYARFQDNAGNWSPSYPTKTITVDTIVPVVTLLSPTTGLTRNNAPLLSYTATEGIIVVKVDGNVVNTISGNTLSALYDGPHTVNVTATDAAGNVGSADVSFTVDTMLPTVSINPVTSPTAMVSQTITGSRENGAQITVSANTGILAGPVTYPTETTWSCTISNLSVADNIIAVTATDPAGNSAIATTTITSTAPAGNSIALVEISRNSIDLSVSESTSIYITMSTAAEVMVKIIPEVQGLNGMPVYTAIQACGAPATCVFDWDGKDRDGRPVPDDAYLYVVEATVEGVRTGLYSPSGSGGKTAVGCSLSDKLDPFTNSPLRINYAVTLPARVTLDITVPAWRYTILNKTATVPGSHSFEWYGRSQDGKILMHKSLDPPSISRREMYCEATLLQENVIITTGATPRISNVETDPHSIELSYGEFARIHYHLSSNSKVTVTLVSPSGKAIIFRSNDPQNAGDHDIEWYGLDPTDTDGKRLLVSEPGSYVVLIEATSPVSGNSSTAYGRVWIKL